MIANYLLGIVSGMIGIGVLENIIAGQSGAAIIGALAFVMIGSAAAWRATA